MTRNHERNAESPHRFTAKSGESALTLGLRLLKLASTSPLSDNAPLTHLGWYFVSTSTAREHEAYIMHRRTWYVDPSTWSMDNRT